VGCEVKYTYSTPTNVFENSSLQIAAVKDFLIGVLRQRATVRRDVAVLRNLYKMENVQVYVLV